MEADRIPDGSKVTKITGEKEYTLKKQVRIHYSNLDKVQSPTIIEDQNLVYLCHEGIFNSYQKQKPLIWKTTLNTLIHLKEIEKAANEIPSSESSMVRN